MEQKQGFWRKLMGVKPNIAHKFTPQDVAKYFQPNYELPEIITRNGIKSSPTVAMDSDKALDSSELAINNMEIYNNINWNRLVTGFIGYGALSILAQNGIVQNIIQSVSTDCTREWGNLKYYGDGDAEDEMKQMISQAEKLQLKDTMRIAMEKTWLFGGTMVYPKIYNDDTIRDKRVLINPGSIKKDSLKYFKVIEPIYCAPMNFNASDPFAKAFYEPQTWNIMGQSVDSSRLMRFNANDAPLLLKPLYQFFGISPVQLALSKIDGFEQVYNEIIGIISKFNLNVLKTNSNALSEILNGSDSQQNINSIQARIQMFNLLRNNFGTLLIDKDMEEWQQFTMSLNTLDKLLNQNLELIAAYTRIPATKLFGTSPQGFGSSGEHELKNYHEFIRSVQQSCLLSHVGKSYDMIQLDLFGKINPDIRFEFNPLETASELEKSQIMMNKSNAYVAMKDDLTPEERRQWLAKDEDMGCDHIDTSLTFPDANEVDNDEPINE